MTRQEPVEIANSRRYHSCRLRVQILKIRSGTHLILHTVSTVDHTTFVPTLSKILRGVRDTADAEEKWGDECSSELLSTMKSVGMLHDVHDISVAAAYKADDLMAETEKLTVKLKYANGRVGTTDLIFRESYRDEYTEASE